MGTTSHSSSGSGRRTSLSSGRENRSPLSPSSGRTDGTLSFQTSNQRTFLKILSTLSMVATSSLQVFPSQHTSLTFSKDENLPLLFLLGTLPKSSSLPLSPLNPSLSPSRRPLWLTPAHPSPVFANLRRRFQRPLLPDVPSS